MRSILDRERSPWQPNHCLEVLVLAVNRAEAALENQAEVRSWSENKEVARPERFELPTF